MISFLQCTGTPLVTKSSFVTQIPWMIPFNISSFKKHQMYGLSTTVPNNINVYGHHYHLAGFTMISSGHYTAVIIWRGDKYYYDGMAAKRFVTFDVSKHISGSGQDLEGSYVIYLLAAV